MKKKNKEIPSLQKWRKEFKSLSWRCFGSLLMTTVGSLQEFRSNSIEIRCWHSWSTTKIGISPSRVTKSPVNILRVFVVTRMRAELIHTPLAFLDNIDNHDLWFISHHCFRKYIVVPVVLWQDMKLLTVWTQNKACDIKWIDYVRRHIMSCLIRSQVEKPTGSSC